MKLKQITEDEFGDLDDKDDFGSVKLDIDPKSISYKKRDISYGGPYDAYANVVLYEFIYNGVLISYVNSVDRSHHGRAQPIWKHWWIDNKPLDLINKNKLVEILEKLDLDHFPDYDITMSLYNVLDNSVMRLDRSHFQKIRR